jgi:pyruvate kinase
VLADLQGPKIRVGKFAEGKVKLAAGDRFVLDAARAELGDSRRRGAGLQGAAVNDVEGRRHAAARRRP